MYRNKLALVASIVHKLPPTAALRAIGEYVPREDQRVEMVELKEKHIYKEMDNLYSVSKRTIRRIIKGG